MRGSEEAKNNDYIKMNKESIAEWLRFRDGKCLCRVLFMLGKALNPLGGRATNGTLSFNFTVSAPLGQGGRLV